MEQKKGTTSYSAIALTSVTSKLALSCVWKKGREPEELKQLLVGGIDGFTCHHLPSADDAAATEALGLAGGQKR